jgi:NAD(P)-dependent dehydrogenase (short-subunit alcohol dehydrogenase family)
MAGAVRVAVVTGASAGVGRATARELAAAGWDVAVLARGRAGLEAAAEEVEAAGRRCLVLAADVADHDAVEEAAARVERELGPIDAWVNGAFAGVFAPFWDVEPAEYRRVTDVTYLGVVNGTMAALRRMRPRESGVIVQVGSALAYRGIPLQSAYCGAKHAVQGFTEALRCELLHERSGVAVTMVQLPGLDTPQFSWVRSHLPRRAQPVAPVYGPEVAARAIVHAAEHPQRREWWVGESTAATLVANAVVPGLLDRYLAKTGFASQQSDEPEEQGRPDNLWDPVDDDTDFGPHGRFADRSHRRSAQWPLTVYRAGVVAGAGLAAAAAGLRKRRAAKVFEQRAGRLETTCRPLFRR